MELDADIEAEIEEMCKKRTGECVRCKVLVEEEEQLCAQCQRISLEELAEHMLSGAHD